jgi:hypothetical protein
MTYQINRGPFIVNKLVTSTSFSNLNFNTLTLTDSRTSAGVYAGTPSLTGLAFSDMTSEKAGSQPPIGMHRPSISSGKYGGDTARWGVGRGSAGSIGVSILSAEQPVIQYRAGYEFGDVYVNDSYSVVI